MDNERNILLLEMDGSLSIANGDGGFKGLVQSICYDTLNKAGVSKRVLKYFNGAFTPAAIEAAKTRYLCVVGHLNI